MKIDMSKKAITNRLKTVDQLRKVCLSLSNSSAGVKIKKQFSDEKQQKIQDSGCRTGE
jgi:hypothetical protein